MSQSSIGFLDLPAELRCMVYEMLPAYDQSYTICLPQDSKQARAEVTVQGRSVPIAILATCKVIYKEAREVVHNHLKRCILGSVPQVIFRSWPEPTRPWNFMLFDEILQAISDEYLSIQFSLENSGSYSGCVDLRFYQSRSIDSWTSEDGVTHCRDLRKVLQDNRREAEVLGFIRRTAHYIHEMELRTDSSSRCPVVMIGYGTIGTSGPLTEVTPDAEDAFDMRLQYESTGRKLVDRVGFAVRDIRGNDNAFYKYAWRKRER